MLARIGDHEFDIRQQKAEMEAYVANEMMDSPVLNGFMWRDRPLGNFEMNLLHNAAKKDPIRLAEEHVSQIDEALDTLLSQKDRGLL